MVITAEQSYSMSCSCFVGVSRKWKLVMVLTGQIFIKSNSSSSWPSLGSLYIDKHDKHHEDILVEDVHIIKINEFRKIIREGSKYPENIGEINFI